MASLIEKIIKTHNTAIKIKVLYLLFINGATKFRLVVRCSIQLAGLSNKTFIGGENEEEM